ncbi:phage shock envelope stress response protein PspM [Mycobacterium sp. smrl_JER01]|uniref:phage shock envelope stress response protein PspM n=1 Tax=Mycobacterium sp. smrl_JER01 TaxID=3402633 RepID=UPI003AC41D2E
MGTATNRGATNRGATNRPGAWRSLAQRGIDTAAEWSDLVAEKLNAVADPRAKLLRKRRWALRLAVFLTVSAVFWVAMTALVAAWDTPVWALFIPSPIAVGAAFLATLAFLRYRWLRGEPLPPQRVTRRLPPFGSAARQPMAALHASERGLFSLLGVMERGRMLPADELRELRVAAQRTSATMAATATEVVSMEKAVTSAPQSRAYLTPTITAFAAQLDSGARQYNEMVAAAAQLVSAANSGSMSSSPMTQRRYRDELGMATDRLMGWAQAFDELGRLRGA